MKAASTTATALLLVDVQQAFAHPTYFGLKPRSTPECEENIARLLKTARTYNNNLRISTSSATHTAEASTQAQLPVKIIHIHHESTTPESPLYPGNTVNVDGTGAVPGTDPMSCSAPLNGEPVMTKSVNSAFIGTDLEAMLREAQIRQLIVVGLVTDHCVSTTVRMGANLGVVDSQTEKGRIVLVSDGCAAYGKEKYGIDGETVHRVNLASLDGEFADVETTFDVLHRIFGSEVGKSE